MVMKNYSDEAKLLARAMSERLGTREYADVVEISFQGTGIEEMDKNRVMEGLLKYADSLLTATPGITVAQLTNEQIVAGIGSALNKILLAEQKGRTRHGL